MSEKRMLIGKEQIRDHYQVDDEGVVTQKNSAVTPTIDMSSYENNAEHAGNELALVEDEYSFSHNRGDNEIEDQSLAGKIRINGFLVISGKPTDTEHYDWPELEAWFGNILSELRSDNPYGRWHSYQALQGQAWQRSESRTVAIDDFFLAIARQARVLANPTLDCIDLLRREHARVTDLFHSNEFSNEALYEAREQVIDKILDQVWHKQADIMIPPGLSTWTIQQLQTQPSYYWADDEIWTWADFWPKAQPLLDKYHQALDQLFILTKLQRLIRRCEQDNLKGYRQLIQPLRRKAASIPVTTTSPEKLVEASKPELAFKDLFTDPTEFDFCLSCLLQNDGQFILLNMKGEWIGRKNSISVLVAWIDQLQYYRKIKSVTRGRLAHLLNAYFQGINLGVEGRMFSNTNEIITKYKAHFRAMLLP